MKIYMFKEVLWNEFVPDGACLFGEAYIVSRSSNPDKLKQGFFRQSQLAKGDDVLCKIGINDLSLVKELDFEDQVALTYDAVRSLSTYPDAPGGSVSIDLTAFDIVDYLATRYMRLQKRVKELEKQK